MTTSPYGNPLGALVEPVTAKHPAQASLKGRHVSVVPRHISHCDDLFDVLGGEENAGLWDYIPNGPYPDREEFRAKFFQDWDSVNPTWVGFTVINNVSQKAVGSISLLNIDLDHRRIEVGFVVFSKQLQGTVASTEVQYLLACLVFDTLGYRRYEWKCSSLNEPSKRAALRLGFKFEGVFRQHMIVKGLNRDTAWYSILDGEWPAVKSGFERWLDDGNFDEKGRQRQGLVALRDAAHRGEAS